jgi:membrane protein YdbS with pleckstrin-like domain
MEVFQARPKETPLRKDDPSLVKILKSPRRPAYIHELEGHYHSPLSSYCYFPDGIKFVAKDSKEQIVLFLRRNFVTNLGWILMAVFLFLAPTLQTHFPILDFLPARFQLVAILMWYVLALVYTLENFLDWFFNVCIVTDERIFDVDFVNLVYREISEANIDQVQDVTVQMGGVIRTIFNYGDVLIQTASEVPRIEFQAVSRPDKVAKILRELRVEEEQEKIEGRVR